MSSKPRPDRSTVVPCLRYADAPAAIDWLCRVFGFERRLTVPSPDGGVRHAQLTLGGGMIMLGSVRPAERDSVKQPDEIGGAETQTPLVILPDVDGAYVRAKEAGGKILLEIADQPFGGRFFTCRDPQGHVWNVGSYDPWAPPA
jgi:uncharacterized glyoxalase superfamily protein PhnB